MRKNRVIACLAVLTVILLLSACGKQEISLQVTDGAEKTTISAFTGLTVEEALTQAQISLGEKDVVTPERGEKLTKDSTAITIERYAKVTVAVEGKETTVELVGGTVADALKQAKVDVGEDDALNMDKNAYVQDGDKITVAKAVQIKVTVDGETKTYATVKKTVEKALAAIGVELGENDTVTPDLQESVSADMEITVVRVEYKETTEEESITFTTKTEYSDSMEKGTSRVRQQGVNGKKSVTYKSKYEDGKLVSKEKKSESILSNAVPKIVVYGTKAPVTTTKPTTTSPTTQATTSGKKLISKEFVEDCNGTGDGYYVYTYSDGTTEIVE